MQEKDIQVDIAAVVLHHFTEDPKLKGWSRAIREEIMQTLIAGAHGMYINSLLFCYLLIRFRWVICQLEAIRKCYKVSHLRTVLRQLPKTLEETYQKILENVPEDYNREVRDALHFLCVSRQPLTLGSVNEAVAFDPETMSSE